MTRLLLLSSALLLLGSAGCELNPGGGFVPQLNVHCLVFAYDGEVGAYINRTYAIDEVPSFDFPDAEAVIWLSGDSQHFEHRHNDHYSAALGRFTEPGDTLRLTVSHPEFDSVSGTTVVPDTFSIVSPTEDDTVDFGSDSLIWTRSQNCAGYYLSLERINEEDTFYVSVVIGNDTLPGVPYDSAFVRVPLQFLRDENPGPYTLRLCALDSNYTKWVGLGGGPLGGGEEHSAGITGGVGVFGAAVVRSVTVVLPGPVGDAAQPPSRNRNRTKSKPVAGIFAYPPTYSRSPFTVSATGRASPAPPPE